MPPRSQIEPKLYLICPDTISTPRVLIIIPRQDAIIPVIGFSPTSQLMLVIATSMSIVISDGPKLRPKDARAGPRKTRMIIPMRPPTNDE